MTRVRHIETGEIYDAVKHDGTDEQAKRITTWINDSRGRAKYFPKGTMDYDLHQAFVLLLRDGDPELIRRGFWVIRRAASDGFFVILGDDLTTYYEPIFDDGTHVIGDVERAFGLDKEKN